MTGMLEDRCLSFMPDVSMRELVNKPFSHFETVLLNESAHFDDMIEEEKAIASEEAQMEIPARMKENLLR